MQKSYVLIGILLAALAVILGAFGAHALKARLTLEQLGTFETGVRYQFYHGLCTYDCRIAVALLQRQIIAVCRLCLSFRRFVFFRLHLPAVVPRFVGYWKLAVAGSHHPDWGNAFHHRVGAVVCGGYERGVTPLRNFVRKTSTN